MKIELLDMPNFQGNAAVNYTDKETPWTRIIEHKWFCLARMTDEKNSKLYAGYKKLAEAEIKVVFDGRLGEYKYYDMDAVIDSALNMAKREMSR